MAVVSPTGTRRYAFIMHISDADKTLIAVLQLLYRRRVTLDNLHTEFFPGANACISLQCFVEKDRLRQVINLISNETGVLDMEWLESHQR